MKKFDLDNLFKNALEEQEFNYDPQAFKEFQALSQKGKKKKRKFPFLWFFLGLLLFSSTGTFLLYNNKSKKDQILPSIDITQNRNHKTTIKESKPKVTEPINERSNISKNINNILSTNLNSSNNTNFKIVNPDKNRSTINSIDPSLSKAIMKNRQASSTPSHQRINNNNAVYSKPSYPNNKRSSIINASKTDLSPLPFLPILTQRLSNDNRSISLDQKAKLSAKELNKPSKKKVAYFLRTAIGRGELQSNHYDLGTGISIPLTSNFRLISGIDYRNIYADNLKPHRGFAQKFNITGSNFYHNSIEADQLHLFSIPLIVKYQYKKTSLSTGIQYSYLIGTRGTITDNKEGIENRKSTWIIETGINRNILQLQTGLSYDICSRWSLDLSYNYFVRSLFTEQNNIQKLSSVSLGVRYYLKK